MSEQRRSDDSPANSPLHSPTSPVPAKNAEMFTTKPPEGGGVPVLAWGVAGLAVLVVVAILVLMGRHKAATPNTVQPLAAYAANLPLSQLAMSESTSLSGGKSTFVDGHIRNTGNQTVTGITVPKLFVPLPAMDIEQQGSRCVGGIRRMDLAAGEPPQQETVDGAEGKLAASAFLRAPST